MSVLSSLSADASGGGEQDTTLLLLSDSATASPFVTQGTWRRVCFLLCPHCQYVEFPGCSTHSMLYSRVSHIHQPRDITVGEEENRRPAESRTCMACAACNDSTETSAPFNTVCRGCQLERCKAVPVLLRESQLVACERAILAHQIAALVETAILHCSTCGAVEFPTIEGIEQLQQQSSSSSSSSSTPFTSASLFPTKLSSSSSSSKSPTNTHGFLFNKYGDISDAKWILGEEEFDSQLHEYEKQVREERLAVETSLRNEAQAAIRRMQENDNNADNNNASASSSSSATTETVSSSSSSTSDSTQPVNSSNSSSTTGPSSTPPAATTTATPSVASPSPASTAAPLTFTALESERLAHRLYNLAKNKFWSLPHKHQHYFTSCTGKFEIVPVALSFSECNYLKKYYHNTPTPPLSHSLRLHEAVRRNDTRALEKLLKVSSFKTHINAIDQNQRTPLHYAAWYGRFRSTELLLHHGANIHLKDNEGKTPFAYAIYWRHAAVVKLLLWSGAASTDEFRKDPGLLEQYIHKRPRGQPAKGWTTADSTALPPAASSGQAADVATASTESQTTPTADNAAVPLGSTTIIPSDTVVFESFGSSSSSSSVQPDLQSTPAPIATMDSDPTPQTAEASSISSSSSSSSVAQSAAATDAPAVVGSEPAVTDTIATEAATETSPLIQFIQVFNEAAGGANAANGGWLVPNPLGAGLGGPPAQVLEHLATAEQTVFGSQALLDSKVDIEQLVQVEQSKLAFLMGMHANAGRDSALHNHFVSNHDLFDRNLISEIFHMLDPYSWHFLCAHSAAARHTHEMFGGCSASTNPHAVCLCAEAGGSGGGGSAFGRPPPTSVIVQPEDTEDLSNETSTMKARRQHMHRPRRASVERTAPSTAAAAPIEGSTAPAVASISATNENNEDEESKSLPAASSSSSSMPPAAAKYRIVDEKIHSFADKNIPFDVPWTSEHTSAKSATTSSASSSSSSIPVDTSERKEEADALGATSDSSLSTRSSHHSNSSSYHALDVDEERKSASSSSSDALGVDAVNTITDPDILFLFSLVPIYTPRKINLPTDLMPFVPQYYCPAELPRGSLDEMLKPAMPRSSTSTSDIPDPLLGLAIVDEVNPRTQSNPEELLKKLKREHAKAQRLKHSSSPSAASSTPSPHGTPSKKGHSSSSLSSRIIHSPNSPSIGSPSTKKQVTFTSSATSSPSQPKSSLRGEIFSLLSPFKGPSSRSPTTASTVAAAASSTSEAGEPTSNGVATSSPPPLSDSAPPLTTESYQSLLAELQNKTEALNRISALVEARPESAAALDLGSVNQPLNGVDPPIVIRNGHVIPPFRIPLSSLHQLQHEEETEEPALASTNVLSPQRAQIKLLPNESPMTSSNEEEEEDDDEEQDEEDSYNGNGTSSSPEKSTPKFGRRAVPQQQSGASTTRVASIPNGHGAHSRGNTTERPRSRPMMNSTASSYTSVSEIITTKPKSGRRAIADAKQVNSPTSRWFH